MIKTTYRFPWIGFLAGSAILFYFVLVTNDYWAELPKVPAEFAEYPVRHALVVVFLLAVLLEWLRFRRYKRTIRKELKALDQKLTELLKSKSQLQNKVQRYADNANKLKLFISDRLLEYIEYDEKYLHFKNIASEIRHNGVISYDKVKTALESSMRVDKEPVHQRQYQDALNAMSYLWDLLDLSTTDNISLYIANKLYEYEELYFRQELNQEDSPVSPVFNLQEAVHRALAVFVKEAGGQLPALPQGPGSFHYEDEHYWITLNPAQQLLGNENYIFLILENLITNALFYSSNRRFGSKYSRIAAGVGMANGKAQIAVYNAGPHIPADVRDQIYKLGFSTKRTRGHNGRGLGLYFVKQIVTGYEGKIAYHNVRNKQETYLLQIQLTNGTSTNEVIEVKLDEDKRPVCKLKKQKEQHPELTLRFDAPVQSAEITAHSSKQSWSVDDPRDEITVLFDPLAPMYPAWALEVHNLKTTNKIVFKPLDINGVIFTIELATAESRLDPEYHEGEQEEPDDLDELNENFRDNDPYVR